MLRRPNQSCSRTGHFNLLRGWRKHRCASSPIIWSFCFALAWVVADAPAAEEGKRVLIVHSFGSEAPPFTTHSTAFETELTERIGERVDLDELYLDHAHYADTDMQEALVDYVQKRQAKWQPDLVVPIGSPAGVFVARHRERLFPQTPVLYTGMDRRRLPPDALQNNSALVGEHFDGPAFIEDILQVAPDTTNIVCVIGASPLERYWKAAFQSDFARFTNRVGFVWLNDLSFDQMLEYLRNLPPHSFIFLILLVRDATGVAHNGDEALRRINEVANAPVNSIFEHQLGLGIVGGRLYRDKLEGEESARLAIRILHGEPASSFPPVIVWPTRPQYDWRELHRWKISEDRLPPGSTVKYRTPTAWERHRSLIVTALVVLLVQAALIVGLMVNLSRRRKAERSLRESEERMKLAATAAELGMWEWDFASNKVWLDGRSRQSLGAGNDKDSDYGRILSTAHPEDRGGVEQALIRAIKGDGIYEHVYRQTLPGGQVRWIAARGQVEFDAGHKPVRMRGVGMDITARKLAEEQARESEREFLLIANAAPVLIWTSGPDKRCTFFNQPWLEFRGRTMAQELGDGWTEGVHPEDLSHCLKIYGESFDARQPFTIEYRLRRHDGQYRWLSDHGVPRYDTRKTFLGYIGSCVDVTERKEAEAQAQRSQQELAHVGRVSTLGALAGSLAHELNQPLTAIVSSAEAAQRFMSGAQSNDEEVRDALKDIAEQGQRAGEIIAGMRAMLKKDPGQMGAQDMNLIVREVIEMVRSDLVNRRVTARLRLDPLLPPVKGHGVQLRQVLLNLVMNGCDAMSDPRVDRRELTIESRRMPAANEVEVSVTDSGPGFPEEMLRHAFEPFRTTKAKGLGLGLAICRSIIATHRGRLVAANNAGEGATLRFTLPALDASGK
jgi:PAS domain S-box-containing protein